MSPEEKVCGECEREKKGIGEEISRGLDFVTGQLQVHNHHLKKYACTCAACGVDVPDFTDASILTGPEFRELGMSLANQLPVDGTPPDHMGSPDAYGCRRIWWSRFPYQRASFGGN